MPKPFGGKIELDMRHSTPDWPAFLTQSPRRLAQRARRPVRRRRPRRQVAVRRPDMDARQGRSGQATSWPAGLIA